MIFDWTRERERESRERVRKGKKVKRAIGTIKNSHSTNMTRYASVTTSESSNINAAIKLNKEILK